MAGGARKLDAVATAEHLVETFRLQLYDAGHRNLRKLRAAFEASDVSGDGHLDEEELDESLRFCGLFATRLEIASLFRVLDPERTGRVSFGTLLNWIRGEPSERREGLVTKAWARVSGGEESVGLADALSLVKPESHPDVVAGRIDAESFLSNLADALAEAGAEWAGDPSAVTEDSFRAVHADLGGASPSDEMFVDWVEHTWGVTEAALGREDMARLGSLRDMLREKVRQKKRGGESAAKYLTRILKFHDGAEDGWLTLPEFRRAIETLGLPLSLREVSLFFSQYPRRGGGPGEPEETLNWAAFRDEVLTEGGDADSGL